MECDGRAAGRPSVLGWRIAGVGAGCSVVDSQAEGVFVRLAERLERLGSQTALAVSIEVTDWFFTGQGAFTLHPGVMKVPALDNIVGAAFEAIEGARRATWRSPPVGSRRPRSV